MSDGMPLTCITHPVEKNIFKRLYWWVKCKKVEWFGFSRDAVEEVEIEYE